MKLLERISRAVALLSGVILFMGLTGFGSGCSEGGDVCGSTVLTYSPSTFTNLKWLAGIYLVSTIVIFASQIKNKEPDNDLLLS